MRYQTLGSVFRNGEARAELEEGRIGEWRTRWGERPRRSSGSNGDDGALRARSEGERASGEELAGANGSGDGGGRVRALLVADQGASKPSHARHAAAKLYRPATVARRGRPRADAAQARARGRRRAWHGEAGHASLARPVGWRRPASEQPPFPFFKFIFPKKLN